jgi:restriction system protein
MAEVTRKRTGELVRRLFLILKARPEGMPASKALEDLANSVSMTPHEAGFYESGSRRFEKIVRFATVDCVKAGWLLKHKGTWALTAEGHIALEKFQDGEALYREAVRLYQLWRKETPKEQEESVSEEEVDSSPDITFEQADEQAWGAIERHLMTMDPYAFQDLVAELVKAMGYHVSWTAARGKDGGVDIIAHSDPLGSKPPRIKIQVKRVSDRVSSDGLRAFISLINEGDVGLFVATAGFTRDAEELARNQERRKITLIDAERLVDLWTEFYGKLNDSARKRLPLTPIYFLTPEN